MCVCVCVWVLFYFKINTIAVPLQTKIYNVSFKNKMIVIKMQQIKSCSIEKYGRHGWEEKTWLEKLDLI